MAGITGPPGASLERPCRQPLGGRVGDLDEREYWDDYQEAYQVALTRCSTQGAPWFVVPADRKWYARLAVQQLVLEHLRALDLQWPEADFDVEANTERLREQMAAREQAEAEAAARKAAEEAAARQAAAAMTGSTEDDDSILLKGATSVLRPTSSRIETHWAGVLIAVDASGSP